MVLINRTLERRAGKRPGADYPDAGAGCRPEAGIAPDPARDFAPALLAWHAAHGRHDLPWQGTRDPYRIWLSEIMLQQTQVASVIPYYTRFLERFPEVGALAAAPLEDVMALWAGLGYYARARNLHACARAVVAHHGGRFPGSAAGLAALPGIGRSTAAAIAAFAYGERAAILDGNVKRVLCRVFAVEGFPGQAGVERRLWALAEALLPGSGIEAYTQGLMDLGATLCTPRRPACGRCPLTAPCAAYATGRTAELPAARSRKALPERRVGVLLVRSGAAVLLERRPPAGVWGGLWSLPELHDGEAAPDAAARLLGRRVECSAEAPVRHTLTHFRLVLQPWVCHPDGAAAMTGEPGRHAWVARPDLGAYGLPAPIRRLLASAQ